MTVGLSTSDFKKDSSENDNSNSKDDKGDHAKKIIPQDDRKMLKRWPHIQSDLYKIFLNRVSQHFHLVIQYSPVGSNFREKINKHKNLMYLTHMLFMRDLPMPELEQLGSSCMAGQKRKYFDKHQFDPPKL